MLAISRKSFPTCLVLSAVLVCLAPTRCAAWGGAAHRVIARIAVSQLTPKTRARVVALLGKDDFVGVSTYADEIRILRPETAGWHFVEIPGSASSYVAKRDCLDGDCIVAVIERLQTTLREPNRGSNRAQSDPAPEALRFLIHLVGDIGQPFHCYEDDRGGNSVKVNFFGNLTNLHAVWDSYMLERMMLREGTTGRGLTEQAYADRLIRMLNNPAPLPSAGQPLAGQGMHLWAEGKPEDWASESHAIAVKAAALNLQISPPKAQPARSRPRRRAAALDTVWAGEVGFYSVQPAVWRAPGPGVGVTVISERYFSVNSSIVEQQLLKSGLRLARLLNDALDSAAQP